MKEQIKIYQRKELLLLFTLLSMSFLLLGAGLNMWVLSKNSCKMPVYRPDSNYSWETEQHFSYKSKEDVNLWILSDIIDLGSLGWIVSIGDLVIIFFALSSFSGLGLYLFYNFKQSRRNKPKDLNIS